jgi:quercetin dioxygenase-like cupin family protein
LRAFFVSRICQDVSRIHIGKSVWRHFFDVNSITAFKLKVMDTKELEKLPKKDGEIEKGTAHIIVELIEYEHNEVVSKSIMKKTTGSIDALSFASGEGLNEKTSPFDTYAQIIDGSAIIEIDGKAFTLQTGEGVVIPAHRPSHIKPNGRFKLLLTVIKSGYE